MGIFPITPLVRQVQGFILQTFDVSEQEAEDYAAEMVSLAESWGSPEYAKTLDWPYRVKKDLGDKLKWKSEQDRAALAALRKDTVDAYEILMEKRKRTGFP